MNFTYGTNILTGNLTNHSLDLKLCQSLHYNLLYVENTNFAWGHRSTKLPEEPLKAGNAKFNHSMN